MKPIHIIVADDHALIREGLEKVLSLESDITVDGFAKNGEEAISLIDRHRPDVALLDINMPVMDGISCLKAVKSKFPDTRVIMLTIHSDPEYVMETIDAGVDGYVLKDSDTVTFMEAIHAVYNGSHYIHPRLSSTLIRSYKRAERGHEKAISKREREVLTLLGKGYSNRQISQALYISEKTVKNHVANLFKKLEVKDRTQAALYAVKHHMSD